jgi:hypothetical protein
LLESNKHVIAVDVSYHDLPDVLERVRAMSIEEQMLMTENAINLLEEQLSIEAVHCYWIAFLVKYAKTIVK